jgi:small-conductance mechanosensitive channel
MMNQVFLGNTVQSYLIALAIIVCSFIAIRILRSVVLIRLKAWSKKTETTVDDFLIKGIENSGIPMLYFAAVYMATKYLTFPAKAEKVIYAAMLFILTFYVLRILTTSLKFVIYGFLKRQEDSETKEKQARGLIIIVNVVMWMLGIVFLLDNLGYDVTAIVAGLGIGGIAIALAAQTILGDLFSYFVIFFDRPFELGDFIVVEDKSGTVEYIGIKTTRLRTLGGEQLICSNTDLTNARVHNYKRMQQRRIVFQLGIIYQSTYDMLSRVPEIVKNIIDAEPDVNFDRGHFSSFGDFSLNFEFVYYVMSSDYTFYMNKQQAIYFEIFKVFEKEGIEFAYPTQTLFIEKTGTNPPAATADKQL